MSNRLSTISPVDFRRSTLPGQVIAGNPLVLLGADFQGGFTATGDITIMGSIDLVGTNPTPSFSINGEPISGGGATAPAGSNGEIQFNDNGVFGASNQMFWDGAFLHLLDSTGTRDLSVGSFSDFGIFVGVQSSGPLMLQSSLGTLLRAGSSASKMEILPNGNISFNSDSIGQMGLFVPNGNLGIGNFSAVAFPPAFRLEVKGDINILDPNGAYRLNGIPFATSDASGNVGISAGGLVVRIENSSSPPVFLTSTDFFNPPTWSFGASNGMLQISGWSCDCLMGPGYLGNAAPFWIQAKVKQGVLDILSLNPLGGPVSVGEMTNYPVPFLVGCPSQDPVLSRNAGMVAIHANAGETDTFLQFGISSSSFGSSWIQSLASNITAGNLLLNPLGGNVGINTQNPQAALDVAGLGRFQYTASGAGFWLDTQTTPQQMFLGTHPTLQMLRIYSTAMSRDILGIDLLTGYVGIGNIPLGVSPSSVALSVYGDFYFTGNMFAENLPNSDPGGGNKFWYDPADGNRVKFSP